jgi:hypothetical protein
MQGEAAKRVRHCDEKLATGRKQGANRIQDLHSIFWLFDMGQYAKERQGKVVWACRAGDVEVRRDQQTLAVNACRRGMSLQPLARVVGDVISTQERIRGVKERQGVTSAPGAEIEYARGGAGEPESTLVGRRIRPRVTSIVEAAAIIVVIAFRDKRPLGHHRSRCEPGRTTSIQRQAVCTAATPHTASVPTGAPPD